jgi:hypothetical protein
MPGLIRRFELSAGKPASFRLTGPNWRAVRIESNLFESKKGRLKSAAPFSVVDEVF